MTDEKINVQEYFRREAAENNGEVQVSSTFVRNIMGLAQERTDAFQASREARTPRSTSETESNSSVFQAFLKWLSS